MFFSSKPILKHCLYLQDGLSTNADKFTKKIYFKQQKNVRVDYTLKLTAEEKSIRLDREKSRSQSLTF